MWIFIWKELRDKDDSSVYSARGNEVFPRIIGLKKNISQKSMFIQMSNSLQFSKIFTVITSFLFILSIVNLIKLNGLSWGLDSTAEVDGKTTRDIDLFGGSLS